MENVFDVLCSALIEPACQELFLKEEGVDLMILMMKYVEMKTFVWILMNDNNPSDKKCSLSHGLLKYWTMHCVIRQALPIARCLSRHSDSRHCSLASWGRYVKRFVWNLEVNRKAVAETKKKVACCGNFRLGRYVLYNRHLIFATYESSRGVPCPLKTIDQIRGRDI